MYTLKWLPSLLLLMCQIIKNAQFMIQNTTVNEKWPVVLLSKHLKQCFMQCCLFGGGGIEIYEWNIPNRLSCNLQDSGPGIIIDKHSLIKKSSC